MKTLFVVLLYLCIALTGDGQERGIVVRVKDGDTYVLKTGDDTITVRLAGVDAPEKNQPYGLDAFYCVRDTILGKEFTIDRPTQDLYGRTVAYLLFRDRSSLSELLVAKGWAWHYTEYDHDPKLESLMRIAMGRGLGLWACGKDKVCPPWLYRKYNWRNRLMYCKGCGFANNPRLNFKPNK